MVPSLSEDAGEVRTEGSHAGASILVGVLPWRGSACTGDFCSGSAGQRLAVRAGGTSTRSYGRDGSAASRPSFQTSINGLIRNRRGVPLELGSTRDGHPEPSPCVQ